ncbi:MAG: RloB domain-containing protein [Bacilli bacterium]|nr:RloB domain-containing protein [Bacilli bacterium]
MARIRRIKKTNPLILIKYEGKNSAERIYFNNFKKRNLRIKYSTGNRTDIKGMLDDLIIYMKKEDISKDNNDKIYLIVDTDLKIEKVAELHQIEKKCFENGIKIITSAPTFEIWYLMHYRSNNLKFSNSEDVKRALKQYIPDYRETMNIYPNISDRLENALKTAKNCEQRGKKICSDLYKINPHTDIYKVVEDIQNIE